MNTRGPSDRPCKLQTVRIAAGLSQSQLSRQAGISVRMLQEYESRARDINGAKLATILKLCNTLNCRLDDILSDRETLEHLNLYTKRTGGG